MPSPIELVVDEAKARGLRIERLSAQSRRHAHDKRLVLIEGRRCQVVPTRRGHPSRKYPHAEYFSLYLPRNNWPDYLIYVSMSDTPPVFRIVPRVEMSKDTGRTPENLERYRDSWDLLKNDLPDSEKVLEILSWQLQTVTEAAKNAGLDVELIKTKKYENGGRWPPVIKRRMLIAGKKCSIFSAARISQDPKAREYNYAIFKASPETWPEFQLHIVNDENSPDIFIVPRNHLPTTTSASLDHPELARYKNAWQLLTQTLEELTAIPPIRWRKPKAQRSPTKHSLVQQEVIRAAEMRGLSVESAEGDVQSHKGVQSFVYISKKRCQVIQTTVQTITKGQSVFQSIPLNLPTSTWADYLIFCAIGEESGKANFYIIPRMDLPRNTSRSLSSQWLKQYREAWKFLT